MHFYALVVAMLPAVSFDGSGESAKRLHRTDWTELLVVSCTDHLVAKLCSVPFNIWRKLVTMGAQCT